MSDITFPVAGGAVKKLVDQGDGTHAERVVAVAAGPDYKAVPASQTDEILGATGAVGDRLDGLLIVPATVSPGNVLIKDGNGTEITVFAGGANSVTTLHPFFVPIGAKCVNSATPGWKITTGADVSVIAVGDFT